jgi:hypothetical protein
VHGFLLLQVSLAQWPRHRAWEETQVWTVNVPADVAHPLRACLRSVARRLDVGPGRALEAMLDHACASWWVPTPRAYRVFARDGWRCTVPRAAPRSAARAPRDADRSGDFAVTP